MWPTEHQAIYYHTIHTTDVVSDKVRYVKLNLYILHKKQVFYNKIKTFLVICKAAYSFKQYFAEFSTSPY